MEDLSLEINRETDNENAAKLTELLREHKGQDVSLLDLQGINNWTDYFIIATVSSKTHMDGLERHVKEFCHEREIDILGCSRKDSDDEWRLIDLGSIIIHLMTSNTREFYDLERLWRAA
ncbi:MAG: ribosome silencing factor [Treponema sp.]|nr:ribosome silencing factor [Treponema sp.]